MAGDTLSLFFSRRQMKDKHREKNMNIFFCHESVVLWRTGETVPWMAKVCVSDIWEKHVAVRLLLRQLHNQQKAQWWLDFIPGR